MRICRVTAFYEDVPQTKFVLICGIDVNNKIEGNQDWYGCATEWDGGVFPFYARPNIGQICYGTGGNTEATNLLQNFEIAVGKKFNLLIQEEGGGHTERHYRIEIVEILCPS